MLLKNVIKMNNESVKASKNIYTWLIKPNMYNLSLMLTYILAFLKLFGEYDIPWEWVFAPIWMPLSILCGLVLLVISIYLLIGVLILFLTISADLIDRYILPKLYGKQSE